MKAKQLFILLSAFFILACEKENSIPDLIDNNPKVTKIYYQNNIIEIHYQDELISSIVRWDDSTSFFYTNTQLDSAKRYYKNSEGVYEREQQVSFTQKNGKITNIQFKPVNFESYTLTYRFIYESDKLVAVKSNREIDTIIYKNSVISEINRYELEGGDSIEENYGYQIDHLYIKDYIDRPNPYYLVSNRLGFPYFSCHRYDVPNMGDGRDYNMNCILNYETWSIKDKLGYDFDEMGRVKSEYNPDDPSNKINFEYQ
jgi:hypothetical protein